MTFSISINESINRRLESVAVNSGSLQSLYNGHVVKAHKEAEHRCYIIPPALAEAIYQHRINSHEKGKEELLSSKEEGVLLNQDQIAERHIKHCKHTNNFRQDRASASHFPNTKTKQMDILVYDAGHKDKLPGTLITSKLKPGKFNDDSVAKALENASHVYEFYLKIFNRNSVDGHGMNIISSVHFEEGYENAFWDGRQMVYGDGDGKYFLPFVLFLDVVGHELTHGVTGNRLAYRRDAGALNESNSDVAGSMIEQFVNNQTVVEASWKIGYSQKLNDGKGMGILVDPETKKTYPLRLMNDPGKAYDISGIGKDDQVSKYPDRYTGTEDEGGVHTNSGIPNKAFYLACKEIYDIATSKTEEENVGLHSWDVIGDLWYKVNQTDGLISRTATMPEFANATIKVANQAYKKRPEVEKALRHAWKEVGLDHLLK